ncbi:hypothetical protein ACAG39_11190 [Caldicellulosiruptoraceae bacterium PP1]
MKGYKLILLGIGIGWILCSIFFYIIFKNDISYRQGNLQNTIRIYTTDNLNEFADALFRNSVIQDRNSFIGYVKSHKLQYKIIKDKNVTFDKGMTYDEILDAVYNSQ